MMVIEVPVTRTVDARGSYLPGAADGAHPGHPRGHGRRRHRGLVDRCGSRIDIPTWIEKAGHRLVGVETRDGYDEIVVEKQR